ncbi:hypothetical protein [Companilactobacillus futsaii]|uniref:Uncharacterized protein n=1 Tax=Companilactobacillus futsaii TaxID=938155 RepID=A0A5B7SZZ8_9LACO|nr:hypothetical protein [Companilactobacillus futsaii]QCX23642.1 hypothetical protein FG051_00320 [Companilactobacillus futsaii]
MSLLTGLAVGTLFGSNISLILGIEVGSIIFSVMFFGHYLLFLPTIFNYWESSPRFIRYSDTRKITSRIIAMFFPAKLPMNVIDKNNIKEIKVIGLPPAYTNLTAQFIAAEEGSLMYGLFLMINNPVKIQIILDDKTIIHLDISKDYFTHPQTTIAKLKLFLNRFKTSKINLSEENLKFINE